MKFRYQLAKKTFKGKKIVERGVEDLISEDQRGNDSSADIPSPLSLDKEAITPVEPEEPKEVSRRDLFSFDKLGDFAEAVEEDRKKQPTKKNKKGPTEEEKEKLESDIVDAVTEEEPSEPISEKGEPSTPGFFKRFVSAFKPDPLPSDLEETDINKKKPRKGSFRNDRLIRTRT